MPGEPVDRPSGEGPGTVLALVGQQLGVSQPRGIIDGDMHILPADPALIALTGAVASDAMADAIDAAELLDVDMDQFARRVALIADGRRPGRESGKPTEPMAAQHAADGGDRAAEPPGHDGTGEALAAKRQDLVLLLVGQPVGAAMGTG